LGSVGNLLPSTLLSLNPAHIPHYCRARGALLSKYNNSNNNRAHIARCYWIIINSQLHNSTNIEVRGTLIITHASHQTVCVHRRFRRNEMQLITLESKWGRLTVYCAPITIITPPARICAATDIIQSPVRVFKTHTARYR